MISINIFWSFYLGQTYLKWYVNSGIHKFYVGDNFLFNVLSFCIIFSIFSLLSLTLQATTKEGYLLKQTWSFQRWKRRYFRLKGHKLFYAKFPEVSFCTVIIFNL